MMTAERQEDGLITKSCLVLCMSHGDSKFMETFEDCERLITSNLTPLKEL